MSPEITEAERREAYTLLCTGFAWLLASGNYPDSMCEAPPSYAEFTEDLLVADCYVEFMRLAREQ